MVYCGGPSRGCRTCKERRVKCDESKPVCNRCNKARRKCRGYPDTSDLVFRHQTYSTTYRVQKRVLELRPGLSSLHSAVVPIPSPPPLHREDVAIHFLFTNIGDAHQHLEGPGQDINLLRQLYANTSVDSALYSATCMLALVIFGQSRAGRGGTLQARARYVETLARIRVALEDPLLVRQDDTLMAICLLNPAEVFISSSTCLPKWNAHAEGALAIVQLRGFEMLKNETSRKLLQFVRRHTAMSRMKRGLSVPNVSDEFIHSMFIHCDFQSSERSHILSNLERLDASIPLLRFRADCFLNVFSLATVAPVTLLLKDCRNIEEELEYWSSKLAPPMKVKRSILSRCNSGRLSGNTDPVREYAEEYTNIWTARAWSTYRVSRIFIQIIVFGCVAWLLNALSVLCYTSELELDDSTISLAALAKARRILQQLVDQICCSVPYHLGHLEVECPTQLMGKSLISAIGELDSDGLEFPKIPQPLGYFSIFWPLLVARSVHVVPASQRQMIKNQLLDLANFAGADESMIIHELNDVFGWPLLERGPVWNGEALD